MDGHKRAYAEKFADLHHRFGFLAAAQKLGDNLPGVIGETVVDDVQLPIGMGLGKGRGNRCADVFSILIGKHDDGNLYSLSPRFAVLIIRRIGDNSRFFS